MKMNPKLASLFALLAFLPATPSRAAEISVNFFYENLDPYGEWVEVGDYGYCWHPRDVGDDWRPYNDGNWAYTDEGWTWVSDEPYGWAVYHYGRWTRTERVGWVWVPDTEWAPAWVSWRRNDHYVGWAPLPPESRTRVGVSLGGWVDAEFDIGPAFYSFVEVRHLGAPRLRTVVLPPRDNITIINQTTNITNITYRNNIVINNGPDYNVVSRETDQPIRRLKLQRRADITDARAARADQLGSRVEGDSLIVAAPVIQKAPQAKPKKVAAKIEKTAVDRGWKDAGDPQQVETARAKIKEEGKGARARNAQNPTPETAVTDPAAQPKPDRPTAAQEPTQPAPANEVAKPGKGKARDRRTTATEPRSPVSPNETTTATDQTAPPKVETPEQPGVARKGEQPDRTGKQRGTNAERRGKSPEAVAEGEEALAEKQRKARAGQPEKPNQAERPDGARQRNADRSARPQGQAPEGQRPPPETQARPERNLQPDRPNKVERPQPPGRPEGRDITDQVDRSIRERSVGGDQSQPPGQKPNRVQKPQPKQTGQQPNAQRPDSGDGKAGESEEERRKKGRKQE